MDAKAPPIYEAQPHSFEPVVGHKQQEEAAPPPTAFGHAQSNLHQLQQPITLPPATGEVYEETNRTMQHQNLGEGENSDQKQIIVIVEQKRNPYNYPAAAYYNYRPSNKPHDLLSCKLRDERVNVIGSGESCACCCHLQLGVYFILVLLVLSNMFNVERYLIGGWWMQYGIMEYDIVLGIYFTFKLIINIVCFIGVLQCKSLWIRPQSPVLLTHVIVAIINTILNYINEAIYLWDVLSLIFIIGLICWCSWIFHRVYQWAYYFEKGGEYVRDMFKPPKKSEMPQQDQLAQPQQLEMQPIQQDGL